MSIEEEEKNERKINMRESISEDTVREGGGIGETWREKE